MRQRLTWLFLTATVAACAAQPAGPAAPLPDQGALADEAAGAPSRWGAAPPDRPIPFPVTPADGYRAAESRGSRSASGAPGPGYWQQWADYRLEARLDVDARRLDGSGTIVYHNNSPDLLRELHLDLHQNLHAPGVVRFEPAEVTGGVEIGRVAVAGRALEPARTGVGYQVAGTRLIVVPPAPVRPGETVELALEWSFGVPRAGAGARMGWSSDNLFFLAYWYPQMTVYDDVVGWHPDPFTGVTEFHSHFASYDVTVDAPAGWVVQGTGRLANAEEVLAPATLERLRLAEASDTAVTVVGPEDFGRATAGGTDGRLRWRLQADTVRDMAFSAMLESNWEAARAPVGDRTGDGEVDHTVVHSFWRETAPRWSQVTGFQQHAITFLSDYTGLPYPWPHMSAVEGGGIIGGGMEFPMMTLMGDYNLAGDSALYSVTIHELGHMWVPMIVSSDERRYSWLDEGHTTFHQAEGYDDFFPGADRHGEYLDVYLGLAGRDVEAPMLRWSAYVPPPSFLVTSYRKPSTVLVALRALLGEDTFLEAHREFLRRWAWRIPYPWDFFRTMEDVSGEDLWWFWRTWYAETWVLDQAVAAVEPGPEGTRIVVEDRGQAPMPVRLTVTREDGTREALEIPVDAWLAGATTAEVVAPPGAPVTRVEIDAARAFPDVDRRNNVWVRADAR